MGCKGSLEQASNKVYGNYFADWSSTHYILGNLRGLLTGNERICLDLLVLGRLYTRECIGME